MNAVGPLLRAHVFDAPAYVTARSRYRDGLLLDANENALGPATPEAPAGLNRYPDPRNRPLREALSAWLDVPDDRLWLGNGSDEVIDLLVRVLVDPGAPVAVIEPSYGVYAQRVRAHGGVVRGVRLDETFDLDVEAAAEASEGCALLFLCSPNNPTGNLLSRDRVLELVRRTRCVVALDEAYVEYSGTDARSDSLSGLAGQALSAPGQDTRRLAVLRTFSKAWGLAGARVGYLVGDRVLVEAMDRVGLPYPLSSLSASVATRALAHPEEMERARRIVLDERERLRRNLEALGLRCLPSDANFLLFAVNEPGPVQESLARDHGIIIRDRSALPGLRGGLRVTVGTPEENDRFLQALREVLA